MAGDLETVEKQGGGFVVDLAGGDALKDLADGALDGTPVFGQGKVEARRGRTRLTGIPDGATGGVVVVTELLATQRRAAAATALGEDVAALIAPGSWVDRLVWHGRLPLWT